MKTRIILAPMLALSLATSAALAQNPGSYIQLEGGTNSVPAATTNVYSSKTISVSDFDNVGVQFSFRGVAAGANSTAYLVCYQQTVDEWDTDPLFKLALPASGTNRVVASTNVPIPSCAAIGKWKIEWPDADTAITNPAVKIRLKAPKVTAK